MAIAIRSYKITFKAYCDPEAYNGFNLALCYSTDTPLTNPIKQVYIKPAYSAVGNYEYTFKDQMMDLTKTYTVFVQVVSFGKDSSWKNIAGFQCPDDGIGTVGGDGTITELTQEELDALLEGKTIDGDSTTITNLNGANLKLGSVYATSINVNDLIVNGLAKFNGGAWITGDMVVDGSITVTGDQIVDGKSWLRDAVVIGDPSIITDAINTGTGIRDLALMLSVYGDAYIAGNQIIDGRQWVKGELVADGATLLKDALDVLGPTHIKNQLEVDGTLTVHGDQIIDGSTWLKGKMEVDGAAILKSSLDVAGNTFLQGFLTANSGAWIDGVSLKSGCVGASHVSANSISAVHCNVQDIITNGINATTGTIAGTVFKDGTVKTKQIDVVDLIANGINASTAKIGGVALANGTVKAINVDVVDLISSGIATQNFAFIKEAHIGFGEVKSAHIGTAEIDQFHMKDGIIGSAQIKEKLSSDNYVPFTSGWQIKKDGTAEFTSGVTIANWRLTPEIIRSADTGARLELNSNKSRMSVIGSTGDTKVAMGYLDGLPKPGGGNYTSSDYGFFVGEGNQLDIIGDGTFSNGDWKVNHDGAFIIEDSDNNAIIKMGTENAETGFYCYDEYHNISAALTNSRFEIGNIATGCGLHYDMSTKILRFVGSMQLTAPSSNPHSAPVDPINIRAVWS